MRRAHRHRQDWEDLAGVDPLWAVLGDPALRGGGWEARRAAFYQSGRDEVAGVLREAETAGCSIDRASALDFGCGVGRVTLALGDVFARVVGMDHSAGMIEQAAAAVRERGVQPIFVRAEWPGQISEAFSLVWCCLVVQHQPSHTAAKRLVRELAERVAPGGALYLQVPVELPLRRRLQPRRRLYRIARSCGLPHETALNRLGLNPISMRAIREPILTELLREAGLNAVSTARLTLPTGQVDVRVLAARPSASAVV